MQDSSGKSHKYIKTTVDEFRSLTTTTHIKELKCGGFLGSGGVKNEYKFQLRQVKTKEIVSLLLDCTICAEDWFFARDGRLSFNCDQNISHIPYHESNTNVESIGKTAYCFEHGYYVLTPEFLETICSCSILKIRMTGESLYEEPNAKWCTEFQNYCRQFYNNVIDSSKFQEQDAAKPAAPGSEPARQFGYQIGKSLAASGGLGNRLANWVGIGLMGLVVIGVASILLPGLKKDANLPSDPTPVAAIAPPPPIAQMAQSNVDRATPSPNVPVVQNAPEAVVPPVPVESASIPPVVIAQTQGAAVVAAIPASSPSTPNLPPKKVDAAAAQVNPPKSKDFEKIARPKEVLNLAGAWGGSFQCGPHRYDQSPKGQRPFNIIATAEISSGKMVMHRSDATYQEELSGVIDRQGQFRLVGEGFYLADRQRPWQTVVMGGVDKKAAMPRLEGRATIGFAGRDVRDCLLVLTRR
jgi:hypothetical protein